MVILARYFLASYAGLFVAILCVTLLSIAAVELLVNFDEIVDRAPGIRGVLSYLVVRLPSYYARDLVPIASFAAAFLCMGLPARRREITAIRAGGIPPQRVAVPVLLAAAILSFGSLLLNETVVLQATRGGSLLAGGAEGPTFGRGSFWYHVGSTLYRAGDADPAAGVIRDVAVYEVGERGGLLRSLRAPRVEVDGEGHWTLRNATLRAFDPARPAEPPRVERRAELVIEVAERGSRALLGARPEALPLQDLVEYIDAREREGRAVTHLRSLLHGRLAEPLAVLLFALLAIPFGVSVERSRSLAVSALQGLFAVSVFYAARTTAQLATARAESPAVALAPWVVLGVFGGLGALRFARMPR